jgi:hypothetical protein
LKKIIAIALNFLILIGCQTKIKKELTTDEVQTQQKEIRKETKVFGDSLKIEYEYRGDTVVQKRIDLKGTSDDNFDSSFTVVSIWSTKTTSKLNCDDELILTVDKVDFKYCYEDVFDKIEQDIIRAKEKDEPWQIDGLKKTKAKLVGNKKGKEVDLRWIKEYYIFDLLREIDFDVYDNRKKEKIDKVRVEKYETNFSGGRNYYFLNKKNDTIARFDITEWIS